MKTQKRITGLRRVKLYCKEECCVGDLKSWKECQVTNCYLYPIRLGKRDLESKKEKDIHNTIKIDNSNQKPIGSYQFLSKNKQLEVMQ